MEAVASDKEELLISKFEFKDKKNELLFFFKPECFLVESYYTERIIEMVLDKFSLYNVDISGILLLKGKALEELGIMDRHYGFINKLSKTASKIITDEEIVQIQQNLEIDEIRKYKLLGGHEFLNEFSEFDEHSLDKLWATRKSIKLRSGFYIQKYTVNKTDVVLVNGFHPAQLKHFTDPSHQIVLFLVHSDVDWKTLKWDLVGNTFPERAKPNSIRGEMFQNSSKYGITQVSISNNCVHLSAGPFEALFEINNFLKDVQGVDFNLSNTNMFRKMSEKKLSKQNIEKSIYNPVTQIDGKEINLSTLTEDKDSYDAIYEYIKYFIS